MTAFDFMIDVLFNDPNLGSDADYYPPVGLPTKNIRVLHSAPDLVSDFQATPINTGTDLFEVRTSEVAEPVVGGTLIIGAAQYTIQGKPTLDTKRLVWTLDVRREP